MSSSLQYCRNNLISDIYCTEKILEVGSKEEAENKYTTGIKSLKVNIKIR